MLPYDAPPPPPFVAPALDDARCAGERITRIVIRRHPPSPRSAADSVFQRTADRVGLEQPETEESVLRAYVRLKPGRPCDEVDRRESERMLRAQPYVASAAVTPVPDGPGQVIILVDVVSEIPWVVGARFGEGSLRAVRFGTLDLDGRGLKVVGNLEQGGAHRPGVGAQFAQYGALGRPAVASLQLERRPLGGVIHVGYSEPFLTDGQVRAVHGSARRETEYVPMVRPSAPDALVRTERVTYLAGAVRRVVLTRPGAFVGLAGLMFTGADIRSERDVFVDSDSGLVLTSDSTLAGRYPDFGVSRLGLVLGLRSLTFDTVSRFDALRAAQDIGTGVMMNLFIAPRVAGGSRSDDVLLAGDVYAGVGDMRSLATLRLRAEGRPAMRGLDAWQGVVLSGRATWHRLTSRERTRVMTLTGASVERLPFPAQLTLRDPDGGVIGYQDSPGAGGRRLTFRVEERRLTSWLRPGADIAIATFFDAGQVWAGDAPFGASTGLRTAAGISLLGAIPSGGKRIYRVDLGVPLNPMRGGAGLALQFTITDRTGFVWVEPRDVARTRASSGPSALIRW